MVSLGSQHPTAHTSSVDSNVVFPVLEEENIKARSIIFLLGKFLFHRGLHIRDASGKRQQSMYLFVNFNAPSPWKENASRIFHTRFPSSLKLFVVTSLFISFFFSQVFNKKLSVFLHFFTTQFFWLDNLGCGEFRACTSSWCGMVCMVVCWRKRGMRHVKTKNDGLPQH